MISVDEALARVLSPLKPVSSEVIAFADGAGRVLAAPVTAARAQPPCDVSAMDGYAVQSRDGVAAGAELDVVGTSQAGQAYAQALTSGHAVRIFTGAAVPTGTDTIVVQENTEAVGEHRIRILEAAQVGRHIRRQGIDFASGQTILPKGKRLSARDLALLAAANVARITVARRPLVVILPTGDELVEPGATPAPHGIVSSTPYALAAYIAAWGGDARILPIARDDPASLRTAVAGAASADMIVTLGGASVGERDLVRTVLGQAGLHVDFWQVAIKPGKPLIYGRFNSQPFLGLPGNPASALVCALLFLRPALGVLTGRDPATLAPPLQWVRVGIDLPANGTRQDYLRGSLSKDEHGRLVATPFALQDSSVQSLFAAADCLIVRPPHDGARRHGDMVEIWPLD